jgi:hypothetical protein
MVVYDSQVHSIAMTSLVQTGQTSSQLSMVVALLVANANAWNWQKQARGHRSKFRCEPHPSTHHHQQNFALHVDPCRQLAVM